ncbi:MAG: hypothetical protein HY097_01205 [Nitrospinae bacterium]|nr:hypothetical protein [Nitrospinota bacterium]MBI3812997.1 hypothetical protein [Nitrospinota bacterium]
MHQVILVFLLIIYPLFSEAKEISYPLNQVERPLTLPKGIWEVGFEILDMQNISPATPPLLLLRYGITDTLEFYPLGLRYRILNYDNYFEMVVKGRITAIGSSSVDGTMIYTEFGLEGKQKVHQRLALLYNLEDYYKYTERINTSEIMGAVGGVFSFTERLSLEVTGMYQKQWRESDTVDGRGFNAIFYFNKSYFWDVAIMGSWGSFFIGDNYRHFYSKEFYEHNYGIRMNWRF